MWSLLNKKLHWLVDFLLPSENRSIAEEYEYFPVSSIIENTEAAVELHKFLLNESTSIRSKAIPCGSEIYEIGLINIDVAPTIPNSEQLSNRV